MHGAHRVLQSNISAKITKELRDRVVEVWKCSVTLLCSKRIIVPVTRWNISPRTNRLEDAALSDMSLRRCPEQDNKGEAYKDAGAEQRL